MMIQEFLIFILISIIIRFKFGVVCLMLKNRFNYVFLFCFSFLFSLILFYVFQGIYCDEIWTYGFSYNISDGLVPYRDFNLVTTPFYSFLAAIFIKLFGNYIIVMHLFDSLLFSIMIILLFKIINWKVLILLPLFMFWWPSGYNFLCLFFLVLIIYLISQGKYNDIVIALIVGVCLITKQNVGIFFILPCLFYSQNKVKTIIVFLLPFLLISVYFVYCNAFYDFLNCCFLGMFEFGNDNKYFEGYFFELFMVIILALVILLIKSKFRNREIFYILMFQLMLYPIFDLRHFACVFFPVMYLILKKINSKHLLFILGFSVYFMFALLLYGNNFKIKFDDNITYFKNSGDLNVLAEQTKKYIVDNDNFFFNGYYGYFIKLYYDIPISQYDLLLSGNVGYKGMNKKLQELDNLCKIKKCYFFLENIEENSILEIQYRPFTNYVITNYEKVDNLFDFDVYTNFN